MPIDTFNDRTRVSAMTEALTSALQSNALDTEMVSDVAAICQSLAGCDDPHVLHSMIANGLIDELENVRDIHVNHPRVFPLVSDVLAKLTPDDLTSMVIENIDHDPVVTGFYLTRLADKIDETTQASVDIHIPEIAHKGALALNEVFKKHEETGLLYDHPEITQVVFQLTAKLSDEPGFAAVFAVESLGTFAEVGNEMRKKKIEGFVV